MNLYDTVRIASNITNSILVGFSGGKDSAATLDLCFKHFDKVQPYFMYIVPGLEFQERTLRYYEKRYGTEIIRIPHFMVSEFLRYGTFRRFDFDVPVVKAVEAYNYLRERTGIYWIAAGERISDSIVRRAMIKESGTIDAKRGRIYPVGEWRKAHIMNYGKLNRLPISIESRVLGFSFRSLLPKEMMIIKQKFPRDYEKIKQFYPLIEASVKHEEFKNGYNKIPKI